MKALYLEDYGKAIIKEVLKPSCTKGAALIKVKSVGICGSDVNAFRKKGQPVPVPLVLGHEITGIIEEIDENMAGGFKIGERVILDPYLYCGKCYPCSIGRTNCCESLKVLGVQTDGAMQEFFVHPIQNLVRLDEQIPWEIAPIVEPLTIALHAIHRTALWQGEKAVIIGAGPIGLLAAMVALQYKAIPILIDILQERLDYAKMLGISYTINAESTNALEMIKELTQGRMAEVVIEASGAGAAIRQSLEYASYCGRIAYTGWPSGETQLQTTLITRKELCMLGSRNSVEEFGEAIDLVARGLINARAVLSEVIPFDKLPQMLEQIAKQPGKYLKVTALVAG
jgi:threonine dehydrogenase-like Zn-dependent dehydrogenase